MSYDPYRRPQHPPPPHNPQRAVGQYAVRPAEKPAEPKKAAPWAFALLAAAILALAGGVWTIYDRNLIFKDSGVKACEALRDDSSPIKRDEKSKTPITEAQYRQMREIFEDSRYDDIRDHGTKLIDVVWQVSQVGANGETGDGEALGAALVYLQPLATHMTGLQSACADQGVIIDLNPS